MISDLPAPRSLHLLRRRHQRRCLRRHRQSRRHRRRRRSRHRRWSAMPAAGWLRRLPSRRSLPPGKKINIVILRMGSNPVW